MLCKPYDHVEEQLIVAIDAIVPRIKEGKATPAEIAALPEIALALAEINKV